MLVQERAKTTRRNIVRSAARAFYEHGYVKASLSDIYENAGVTKGALYFHFASKEALAHAVIAEQLKLTHSEARKLERLGRPALETMIMFCVNTANQLTYEPMVQAGIRLRTEVSSFQAIMAKDYYDAWFNTFEAVARRAIAEGDIRSDIDPVVLAQFVVPTFTGVELVSNLRTGREDFFERIRQMWSILIPGLVPESRYEELKRLPETLVRLDARAIAAASHKHPAGSVAASAVGDA